MTDSDAKDFYAGLSPTDWHTLKSVVLDAAYGDKRSFVPQHLQTHAAAKYLESFLETGDKKQLDLAARALCPSYPENAWLALAKS